MINIICFGNPLCSDDGAGQAVFGLLQTALQAKPEWDGRVALFYGGNSGQRTLPYFMNCSGVIVVDALFDLSRQQAGMIHRFSARDLKDLADDDESAAFSSHVLELPQSWRILKELLPVLPELTLFAIEIADVTPYREGLSPEVEQACAQVAQRIMLLCQDLVMSD